MPLPKLSPLQSRLAASLIAFSMLVVLYLVLSLPQFAYASLIDSIQPEDHNHERLLGGPILDVEAMDLAEATYEAQFLGTDRSIIGRATTVPVGLVNNRMDLTNIQPGQTVSYMFSNASLWSAKSPPTRGLPSQILLQGMAQSAEEDELEAAEDMVDDGNGGVLAGLGLSARQSVGSGQRTLYISVTACSQPEAISNTTSTDPPQLQLYVSQSKNNANPGPGQNPNQQVMVELDGGYALQLVNATGDVYIGVYAQNSTLYSGVYSAQIAASIDAPYHYYWNSSDPNVFLVDSDDNSALLYTDPFILNATNATLYEEWMDVSPPFVIFANDATDGAISGLQRSYCGLQKSQIGTLNPGQTTSNVVTSITSRGLGNLPRQQFYIDGLSPGRKYHAVLAMNGNSTASGNGVVGGGGQVFHITSFNTLSEGNCQVITDLPFCDQTAYSVPANPNTFPNMSSLAQFYDSNARLAYSYFRKAMAQIPCETTSSAQYSLARTCADCEAAYKAWLCAVTIPRCTDYTSPFTWLQPRALGQPFPNNTLLPIFDRIAANNSAAINNSRNANIDQFIVPGPYKEVLPCDDLCYELVQSCPASLGFGCPLPGQLGFNTTYGQKPMGMAVDANGRINNITCNKPGAVYFNEAKQESTVPRVVLCILFIMAITIVTNC